MLPQPAHRRRHRADVVCKLRAGWGSREARRPRGWPASADRAPERQRLALNREADLQLRRDMAFVPVTTPICPAVEHHGRSDRQVHYAQLRPLRRPPTPTHSPRSHAGSITTTAFTHQPTTAKQPGLAFLGDNDTSCRPHLKKRQDATKKCVDSSLSMYAYIKQRFVDKTTLPRNRSLASGLSEECDHADEEELPFDAAYARLVDGRATDLWSRFRGRCSWVRPVRATRVCAIRHAPIRPQPGGT